MLWQKIKEQNKKTLRFLIKYRFDCLSLVLLSVLAPHMMVKKQRIDYRDKIPQSIGVEENKKAKLTGIQSIMEREYSAIKVRNLFAQDGRYEPDPTVVPAPVPTPKPVKTYRLLGIINSSIRRAVLLDNAGVLLIMKEGEKVEDAGTVAKIGTVSVLLKNEATETELKIFEIKPR